MIFNHSKSSIKRIVSILLVVLYCLNLVSCTKNANISSSSGTLIQKETSDGEGLKEPSLFDEIVLGKYEQDGNLDNGREDVVWEIIEIDDESILLLSKYVIDVQTYDDNIDVSSGIEACTWESSYLREYLNDDFYNAVFNDEEKTKIILSDVVNGKVYGVNNSDIPIDLGPDTRDKVYILSKDEIRKYLGFELNGHNDKYMARFSNFAKTWYRDNMLQNRDFAIWYKEKEYDKKYDDYAEYWVRSSCNVTQVSDLEYTALIVTKDGHLSSRGYPYYVRKIDDTVGEDSMRHYNRGIRPVIRIKRNVEEATSSDDKIADSSRSYENSDNNERKIYNIEDIRLVRQVSSYSLSSSVKDFDTILFGSCEQDNNISNGKEAIEWIVLDKSDDKILIASKYIIDYVEYSNVYDKRVTWYNSRLRAYANNEFYNNAFNEREKIFIKPVKYNTYDNPVYNSLEERETIDKIAILGYDECMKYFDIGYDECIKNSKYGGTRSKSKKLNTTPTTYAKERFYTDEYRLEESHESDFWLRNEGHSGEDKTYKYNSAMSARDTVDFKGSIYDLYMMETGNLVKRNLKLGFRPIIWIDSQISLLP